MLLSLALTAFVLPIEIFSSKPVKFWDIENTILPNTIHSILNGGNDTKVEPTYPKDWLADLLYQSLVRFSIKDIGSAECTSQSTKYRSHLKNNSYWAVKMSDSWPRYLNGLLIGNTHHMGVYDECVSVHQPIQGKYCMSIIDLRAASNENFTLHSKDVYESSDNAWQEILGFIDYGDQFKRNVIRLGICVPEACTAADLEKSLQSEVDRILLPHQLKAQIEVQPNLCSTDKDLYPFEIGYYITGVLIGLLLLVVTLSTAYHLVVLIRDTQDNKTCLKIITIFSAIRNGRNLIKYNRNNNLNIYNGLKVTIMIIVLFTHKYAYFVINPILYPKFVEEVYTVGPYFPLTIANIVDPFFFITGYLIYIMMIPQFTKPDCQWFHIPFVIVYKYLRTLPIYIVMILLTTFVVPHLGDGPFWANRMWHEADKCKTYWWTNILAVSNFIQAEKQCLVAGLYISCVIQLLTIGTIIIYIYAKKPKIGTYIMALLLITSLTIRFAVMYHTKSFGIARFMISSAENPLTSYEYSDLYTKIYMRGIPFYAGLLAGVAADALKQREIKISTTTTYISTTMIIVACMYVQMYGMTFYEKHRQYDAFESAIYGTLSNCIWATIFFWIAICHTISSYGPIEKMFNNRFVVPLGRLSYSVYLINITVMMMIENSKRTSVIPTVGMLGNEWIIGVFKTYLAAVALYLVVEAPIGLLIKIIIVGSKFSTQSVVQTIETNSKCETVELSDTTKL